MDAKTRRIWTGLVSYANGTATADGIRNTIVDCVGWVATIPWDLLDRVFVDEKLEDLSEEAEAYRPHVESLLRFLCSEPNSEERNALRAQALEFLRAHGEHIRGLVFREAVYGMEYLQKLNQAPGELESFNNRMKKIRDQARYPSYHRGQATMVGEDSLPLGLLIPSRGYTDFADPICDFLCSEYEKYLYREASRKDKKAAPLIPIFVCPSCKKLVMPKRIGRRQYCSECSDRARTDKYRQRASPDEGRDYAWLYRLRNLNSDMRKIRLRQPKVKQRLTEIKSRQKNSRRCQGLLQVLHL
jgi:hypothetical protein